MKKHPSPELSRLVDATKLNRDYTITPTDAERAAIAKRLGLLALDALSAELRLSAGHGGQVRVKGKLTASVAQSCVVSLEPVPEVVEEEIEAIFSDEADENAEPNWDDDTDAPEPIVNGKIDLGELVVQHLSLGLNPYPRKEGVEFQGFDDEKR